MKKKLLVVVALLGVQFLFAQETKKIELLAVAEGNFGGTNGDVFTVSNTSGEMVTEGPFYQNANGVGTGFNVLQDFEIVGDKAILVSNAAGFRVVIAEYPSLTAIETFTSMGSPAAVVGAGVGFAYVSFSNPTSLRQIDLTNNTITPVIDTENLVSGSSKFMAYGNGYFYAAMGTSILKVDPTTNTTVSKFPLNIGSITGLQFDAATQSLWALGKVNGVSALQEVNTQDDSVEEAIILTGVTNASQLRFGNHKLYFLSGINVHAYDIENPDLPTSAIYTSTLPNTYFFAYGKAFQVDPVSGDFVIGNASGFTGNSAYEIIDGTTYEQLVSGTVTGCIGVNEFVLKTTDGSLGVTNPTADRFTFYPNPATDIVNFHSNNDSNYTVTLYNQLGVALKTIKSNAVDSTISVADLPSGIYFAQLQTVNSTTTTVKKIVVSH
ncbi:T9SS type A sorting domain-containing protein [Flavobacterium sp. PLA-1-15]|uniref:T9SS type A sorting domain-containing protein n=1 Tax=Flavobacterium sp. PLA-1-15 TaxID=3380533 RepID=UPI003B7BCBEA